MAISHVQVLSIPVSDQERALEFYRDRLGFLVISDEEMQPGMRWLMLTAPGGGAALTLVTWFDSMPAGSLRGLVIETTDLEKTSALLTASGITVGSLETAPWGQFVQVSDPDGNGLILQESTPN